jgi:hypothetical protein
VITPPTCAYGADRGRFQGEGEFGEPEGGGVSPDAQIAGKGQGEADAGGFALDACDGDGWTGGEGSA